MSFFVPTTNLSGLLALAVASSIHREMLVMELSSDRSNTTITTANKTININNRATQTIKEANSDAISNNFDI